MPAARRTAAKAVHTASRTGPKSAVMKWGVDHNLKTVRQRNGLRDASMYSWFPIREYAHSAPMLHICRIRLSFGINAGVSAIRNPLRIPDGSQPANK